MALARFTPILVSLPTVLAPAFAAGLSAAGPSPQQVQFGPASSILGLPLPTIVDTIAADLDGDGIQDVVALTRAGGTQSLAVSPGLGGREFGPLIRVENSSRIIGPIRSGDVDNDGDVDVVALTEVGGIFVFLNDGTGTLGLRVLAALPGDRLLDLADANADGMLDVFAESTSGNVTVHVLDLVSSSTFPRTTAIPASGAAIEDLDGDGRADVVQATGALAVWGALPDGTYAAPNVLAQQVTDVMPTPDVNVQLVDVDSDGNVDIVPANLNLQVSMPSAFLGDGNLGFARVTVSSATQFGAPIRFIHADQDGIPDLLYYALVAGDPFDQRTLLSLGTGSFPLPPGTPAEIGTLDVVAAFAPLDDIFDLDGDGTDDIVEGAAVRYGPFAGPSPGLDFGGSVINLSSEIGPVQKPRAIDVDGDGLEDIVALGQFSGTSLVWRRALGGLEFEAPQALLALPGRVNDYEVAAEGSRRLVAAVQLGAASNALVVKELGGLGSPERLINTPSERVLAFADLDGDGNTDVLTDAGYHPLSASGNPSALVPILGLESTRPDRLGVADLDADGDLDIVTWPLFASGGRVANAIRNVASGQSFLPPAAVANVGSSASLVDFDSDGRADLVTRALDSLLLLRGRGTFTFDPPIAIDTGLPAPPSDGQGSLRAIDIDGDGDLDLVLAAYFPAIEEGMAVWVNPGDTGGAPTISSIFPKGLVAADGAFRDLDRDGDLDVLDTRGVSAVLVENLTIPRSGTPFCEQPNVNSTGQFASLEVYGTPAPGGGDLLLQATRLPAQTFGIFVGSPTTAAATALPASAGFLCLGPGIGRYARPNEIVNSTAGGYYELRVSPTDLRTGNGSTSATSGLSWSFQSWYRDVLPTGEVSHLTPGVTVVFE